MATKNSAAATQFEREGMNTVGDFEMQYEDGASPKVVRNALEKLGLSAADVEGIEPKTARRIIDKVLAVFDTYVKKHPGQARQAVSDDLSDIGAA